MYPRPPSAAETMLSSASLYPQPPNATMKVDESDADGEYEIFMEDDSSDNEIDVNGFRITGALDPAKHKVFTTKELHEKIHEGIIDLNPPYQRDVVWTAQKQTSLIDSLWMNYHVPTIVFVARYDGDEEQILVCVDGKQRLTSIQRFLDGQIPHKAGKKFWWFTLPQKNKPNHFEIPQKWKDVFHSKEISCEIYHDLTDEIEREMFRRVQHGMPLTAAEKLKAVASPMANWIGHLEQKHVEIDEGLAQVLAWDKSRGKAHHNIMHMAYCCEGYPEERISFGSIGKWLESSSEPPIDFQTDMDKVLVDFWKIASDGRLSYPFSASPHRVAPVEFIFIGVLLFVIRDHDLKTKARAIDTLRKGIRTAHVDVRNNNKVAKTLWDCIKCLQRHPLRELRLKGLLPESVSRSGGKKRRRKSNDEDDDYRG